MPGVTNQVDQAYKVWQQNQAMKSSGYGGPLFTQPSQTPFSDVRAPGGGQAGIGPFEQNQIVSGPQQNSGNQPGGFHPPANGGGSPPMVPSNPSPVNGNPGQGGLGQYGQGGAYQNYDNLPQLFSQGGGSQLQDLYNSATGGTINAYNTAANRLRERLDSSTQGQQMSAQNQSLGRGFGNSGYNDARQNQIASQGQNAYAQGLNDLSNTFETQRQQGLQLGLNASNQDTLNRNNMDQNLYNLINSREGRQNDYNIAAMGSNTQKSINSSNNANQANMNNQNNQLQQLLAQLTQFGQNYRTMIGGSGIGA